MASKSGKTVENVVGKVWGFLDQLAESNPEEYQKFVSKAMEERREFLEPPLPVFCFSTGIRGKEHCKLYVNVCTWTRIPRPRLGKEPIPVKGGVLRHLVEDGTRRQNELLFDIAFHPHVVEECTKSTDLRPMLISLSLDFTDEYLSVVTDGTYQVLPQKFKGPRSDVVNSLDDTNAELLSRQSRLDLGESILGSLKRRKGKKAKNTRKGTYIVTEIRGSQSKLCWTALMRANNLKTAVHGTSGLPPLFPQQQQSPQNDTKLIEEVPRRERRVTMKRNCQVSSETQGGTDEGRKEREQTPDHTLDVRSEGEREVVCVTVHLPGVSGVADMELDVSQNDLRLLVPGVYCLSLSFPLTVNEDSTRARFSKRSRTLSITIPSSASNY